MHHSRLAASLQNASDVQSPSWASLPISCSEACDVQPTLLQCSCSDTAWRHHNLGVHDCKSANVCLASCISSDDADTRRKIRVKPNDSLQILPCDLQVSYASVSRAIRPTGHRQAASLPAPFGDSNDTRFFEHASIRLYNPAQWFIFTVTVVYIYYSCYSRRIFQQHINSTPQLCLPSFTLTVSDD